MDPRKFSVHVSPLYISLSRQMTAFFLHLLVLYLWEMLPFWVAIKFQIRDLTFVQKIKYHHWAFEISLIDKIEFAVTCLICQITFDTWNISIWVGCHLTAHWLYSTQGLRLWPYTCNTRKLSWWIWNRAVSCQHEIQYPESLFPINSWNLLVFSNSGQLFLVTFYLTLSSLSLACPIVCHPTYHRHVSCSRHSKPYKCDVRKHIPARNRS
jgi:hypothetical protein